MSRRAWRRHLVTNGAQHPFESLTTQVGTTMRNERSPSTKRLTLVEEWPRNEAGDYGFACLCSTKTTKSAWQRITARQIRPQQASEVDDVGAGKTHIILTTNQRPTPRRFNIHHTRTQFNRRRRSLVAFKTPGVHRNGRVLAENRYCFGMKMRISSTCKVLISSPLPLVNPVVTEFNF